MLNNNSSSLEDIFNNIRDKALLDISDFIFENIKYYTAAIRRFEDDSRSILEMLEFQLYSSEVPDKNLSLLRYMISEESEAIENLVKIKLAAYKNSQEE